MRVLGISSATKIISVGLIDEEKVLVETTVANLRAEKIIFYMKEAGILPEMIEAVAVARGPGSYSGLRGGLAVAKSLAQTLNVPLAGVSTLEAIAYNLVDIEGTMAVILDARADDYNFALFSACPQLCRGARQGKLNRLTDDLVLQKDKMIDKLSKISGEIHLVGNLLATRDSRLVTCDNFRFAEEMHSHPYGINVARLGLLKIKEGKTADPLKSVPFYSHKPNIREYKR